MAKLISTILMLFLLACSPVSPKTQGIRNFTFASMGDAQGAVVPFTKTVKQVVAMNPNLILFTGDLEDTGATLSQMAGMTSVFKNAGVYAKTYAIRGNHDDEHANDAIIWDKYFQRDYFFYYGNSAFIGLDVPGTITKKWTDSQLKILDADLSLAKAHGSAFVFVFFHGPLYCADLMHCTCVTRTSSLCTPTSLITELNKYPIVSAIFVGHNHLLAWTHVDNTRLLKLKTSFEEFFTSPAGGSSHNALAISSRLDYLYKGIGSGQGFAMVTVSDSSYSVRYYKTGTVVPVWNKTFSSK